jgi:hypothetical protein
MSQGHDDDVVASRSRGRVAVRGAVAYVLVLAAVVGVLTAVQRQLI